MAGLLVTKEELSVTGGSAITTKIENVCVFHHSSVDELNGLNVYAVQEMGEGIVYIHLCRHHRGDRTGTAGDWL